MAVRFVHKLYHFEGSLPPSEIRGQVNIFLFLKRERGRGIPNALHASTSLMKGVHSRFYRITRTFTRSLLYTPQPPHHHRILCRYLDKPEDHEELHWLVKVRSPGLLNQFNRQLWVYKLSNPKKRPAWFMLITVPRLLICLGIGRNTEFCGVRTPITVLPPLAPPPFPTFFILPFDHFPHLGFKIVFFVNSFRKISLPYAWSKQCHTNFRFFFLHNLSKYNRKCPRWFLILNSSKWVAIVKIWIFIRIPTRYIFFISKKEQKKTCIFKVNLKRIQIRRSYSRPRLRSVVIRPSSHHWGQKTENLNNGEMKTLFNFP